jgi:gamma-glutamyltranspeptidase / glutathione hydrolase
MQLTPDLIRDLTRRATFGRKQKVTGRSGVAISSHPIVTRVATNTLRAGGNAVDAILAAAVAQTVVEPHMSTIFGMLSMLYYDASNGRTLYLNGAGNAPKAPLGTFTEADLSTGRAVAVPGFWAAYEAAREKLGSMPSERLIAPAIELAASGFPVYPFLYGMMFEQSKKIGICEEGRSQYFRNNRLLEPGELCVQRGLATTLELLASRGRKHFYESEFTQRVVDTVASAGGVLTREDFASYEVRWMEPAWGTYRGYRIAASPPPDSGGTHLIEILNLVEQIPSDSWGPPAKSPDTFYWLLRFCSEVLLEGSRHRDPRSWHVPLATIVSKDYAHDRYELMRMSEPGKDSPLQSAPPYPGSNHITVSDSHGNIATALHSVMSMPWSNGLVVDGVNIWAGGAHFLRQLPNPGDRATCYVAPHIVFNREGQPVLAGGSPSVGLIANCIQNALNILDFERDIETSVHLPRFGGIASPSPLSVHCEIDFASPEMQHEMNGRGMRLDLISPWHYSSGSYEGIHFLPDAVAEACADPRRAGQAEIA